MAKQTLQQQLQASQARTALLLKKIEDVKKKPTPKTIFDRVSNFKDILKIAKPTKEELVVINYSGKSKRLLFVKHTMVCALITEVLNEGSIDNIWFPVFKISGSGSVFSTSIINYYDVYSAVGSALRFKDERTSNFAAKTFPAEYKNLLVSQQLNKK